MRPEHAVMPAVASLAAALRAAGLCAGIDQQLALCRALAEVDVRSRDQVYWAARACFLQRPDERRPFDALFERFWAGRPLRGPVPAGVEHGESDPRMPAPQHGGVSLPQFRLEGRSSQLLDGEPNRASEEIPTPAGQQPGPGGRRGALAAYSPEEIATEPRRLGFQAAELSAIRALAAELRRRAPERRSRRPQPTGGAGRLDLRRTLRRSLRTDGEPLRPALVSSSLRPRRLLLICDVSGSMERYSRSLLGHLQAAIGAISRTEAFVFATRLTRLTGALGGRDVGRALERARAEVEDWSGGTRIGAALAEFNRRHARLGLARGAIAIVVSDGWDRGDPALLAREVARLQLLVRRLIWVNPRQQALDEQPLAIGMKAALPHVDDYVPGFDPRAMAGVAALIAGADSRRPARRQRAVSSLR